MSVVRFRLAISAESYLAYYQGAARNIIVRAHDGRRIQFPAEHLRAFVTREGVHGEFELEFDASHRLVALRQVA